MERRRRYVWLWGMVFFWLALFVLVAELLGPTGREWWIGEGGIVEDFSAAGYFVCIVALFRLRWKRNVSNRWYVYALLLLFGLRELDFHTRFTAMGIFKTRFFLSPEVPPMEKIVGGAILLALLLAAVVLAKKHGRDFARGVRAFDPKSVSVLLGIGLLFFSKSIDGFSRKLDGIGLSSSEAVERFFHSMEESLELGIPVFFLIAIVSETWRQVEKIPSSGMVRIRNVHRERG